MYTYTTKETVLEQKKTSYTVHRYRAYSSLFDRLPVERTSRPQTETIR